jgi:hypothetical protein
MEYPRSFDDVNYPQGFDEAPYAEEDDPFFDEYLDELAEYEQDLLDDTEDDYEPEENW